MKKTYLDTPNAAVALNFKVGSSTLSRAVIKTYHSELERLITEGAAYPAGKSADNTRWHFLCPKVDPSDRPVTLLAVRDPIEKFKSACAESRIADVDAKLTDIETNGFTRDSHFWPQSRLLHSPAKLYRFPTDFDELAVEAGLSLPLVNIDGGRNLPKPELTVEQILRVEAIYAEDIDLYESITEAGTLYEKAVVEPEPEPEPEPVPYSINAWQAKAALRLTPHPQGGDMLTAAEAAISNMPEGVEKVIVQSAWANIATFERTSPTILSFGQTLGLSSDDLDNLFRLGGTFQV